MYTASQARLEISTKGKIEVYQKLNRIEKLIFNMRFLFHNSDSKDYSKGRSVEKCYTSDYLGIYIVILGFSLIIPYLLYIIRNIRDSFGIQRELTACMISFFVFFTLNFLASFGIVPLNNTFVGGNIFFTANTFICHFISVVRPVIRMYYHERAKRSMTIDPESFEKVLSTPAMFAELKKIMADMFCVENAMLGRKKRTSIIASRSETPVTRNSSISQNNAASLFIDSSQKSTVRGEDNDLYERYVKPGSPFELNLPHKLREKCTEMIKEKSPNAFDEVYKEVWSMIYQNSFPRYVSNMTK
ncbi:hypothetical protein O9G_002633 [Rozella allomycis CSF55]|uniref:RGS domain-containing protein n=1 Tax=Rozella allomycis (strain CSF55) TaxID=988480 RepID=A0A075AZB3_ROZAC|nr:hypothetical protein O9G_002633 [Rozella allomycis CSF55]|eukprot:EPZ35625.1 hypothetical protein O9G_002633 [Rozella allomycis CSF55]